MCVHACLYACASENTVTVKKRGLMNLKENKERYLKGFGGKKGKESNIVIKLQVKKYQSPVIMYND